MHMSRFLAIWSVVFCVLIARAGFAQCPTNAAGGPSVLTLRTPADGVGADFDLGTAGGFHNVELPGVVLDVCLTGCDAGTAQCTINQIRPDPSAPALTPPIPSLQSSSAICTRLLFPTPTPAADGTANVQTGAIALNTTLRAQFFSTSPNAICPECVSGNCVGGAGAGNACQVDTSVTVGAKTYALSRSCQPNASSLLATASIPISLVTGAATQAACPGQSSTDRCASAPPSGTCGQTGCTQGADGITQDCCSLSTARSCFPPSGVSRTGLASAPTPATYPKTASETLASASCVPASGALLIDGVFGLPGIAAAQLAVTTTWFATDPGPSSSTTTTQPGATTTTTTTLPNDCSPSDCADDDTCTTDTCSGSTCGHTLQSGIAGVRCLVGRMKTRPLCGTQTVDAKLTTSVGKALGKADGLLAKVDAATGKKRVKFVKKATTAIVSITKLATKAAKKHKIDDGCRTTISNEVTRIRNALTAAG